jgi:hypothetical protein
MDYLGHCWLSSDLEAFIGTPKSRRQWWSISTEWVEIKILKVLNFFLGVKYDIFSFSDTN